MHDVLTGSHKQNFVCLSTDLAMHSWLKTSVTSMRSLPCSKQELGIQVSKCCIVKLTVPLNPYKLYKSDLDPEAYLTSPFPHKYKQLLSNFRFSGHQLMIEKGRHLRIERDLGLCLYCQQQGIYIVVDEVHFLLHCPMYKHLDRYIFLIYGVTVFYVYSCLYELCLIVIEKVSCHWLNILKLHLI